MLGSDASNSGGNSETFVDASTQSTYRSDTVFIPSVVPFTPPSQLAVGNVIKETFACGPLQRIVRTPVDGTFIGLLSRKSIPQGYTDDLQPVLDADGAQVDYRQAALPDGSGYRLFGHQVTMFTTVIGVASNRNIAIGGGGGGSGGGWGQGGMGSSSSNQRMVTSIQLRECEVGTVRTVVVEVPPRPIRG